LKLDASKYAWPSRRTVVFGSRGIVATSQPLAAQAGLDVLKCGGNAVDAAVATAAALTVVEPTSNGIGGDAFALVWSNGELHGLNASGPAPMAASADFLREQGYTEMPLHSIYSVTVPGAPAAWASLIGRFGKLNMLQALKPAIEYAENGFPVSPTVAGQWKEAFGVYSKNLKSPEFAEWFNVFALDKKTPAPGEFWCSILHAETLRKIAETNAESFYNGELAEKIHEYSQKHGGWLNIDDLASFSPQWVKPVGINYRGVDIWEIPPNGQGVIALMALNMLKGFEFKKDDFMHPETCHKQIEAIKLAFTDGLEFIAEPRAMEVIADDFVSDEYANFRRGFIKAKASSIKSAKPAKGGTVYIATADSDGNMVSMMQSNYTGFGSGLVVPATGIALHNRGCNFNLNESHPNCLRAGNRSYHTIIPGFMTRNGRALGAFGVMGAFMQPQGQLQAIMNMFDFGMNPQEALDAPRWQWTQNKKVLVETSFSLETAEKLRQLGHDVNFLPEKANYAQIGSFGRGEIIIRLDNGAYAGATEPRADGYVAVW